MAKKFVRGITDIKTISKQDFDTNNVNDLLSDGEHNYIHRKKGKTEEYHNLTDNLKTISSSNTDLIEVTNNNTTNNTATLNPKHDGQKEQVLESERNTITINHGSNGTTEKTKVDTNPEKVLEHEKLKTGDGLATLFNTDETTIIFKPKALQDLPANNGFYYGDVTKDGAPYATISLSADNNKYVQLAFRESVSTSGKIIGKYRFMNNNVPTRWNEMLLDDATIKGLLAQKQNRLTAMGGISITGDSISLTVLDRYSGDLNNLTYTCQAKPVPEAPNLPTGVYGHGILTATRIGDVVSQQYHTFDNMLYVRTARYADGSPGNVPAWTPWVKVTTTALS